MGDRDNAEPQNQKRRQNADAPLPRGVTSPALDSNQPHGENGHEAPDSHRQKAPWFRDPDWHMVILTALLFIVGVVTLRVFYKQFAEMQAQTKVLTRQAVQASMDSTEASAKIARQLEISQDQAEAARASAAAAQDTAATAMRAMKIQSSPWLAAVETQLVARDPSWRSITYKLLMTNTGSSPATNVRTVQAIAVFDKRYITESTIEQYRSVISAAAELPGSHGMVLPHQNYDAPETTIMLTPHQTNAMLAGGNWLFVMAEVTYDDIFDETSVSTVCNRLEGGLFVACNVHNSIRRLGKRNNQRH
jgi:hypothetical protein